MAVYLDHYCERVAPGLWGEPLNMLTSLAFVVAAVLAARVFRRSENWSGREWDLWGLLILMFAIGFGSGLWHILATPWALQADHYPILLFINLYLLSCLFRVFRVSVLLGIAIFIGYHVVNRFTQALLPSDFLNGSVFYAPTWAFLIGLTVAAWYTSPSMGYRFTWAAGMFTLSLGFRTIDLTVCGVFPWGTHFLWHLTIAATLYFLFTTLLRVKEGE